MSCKYNNSMYTIEPEEVDVCFDEFEQLLLSEDYESQEELNHRLNEEYFQVYELTNDEMLEFARAGAMVIILLFLFAFLVVGPMDPYTNGCLV